MESMKSLINYITEKIYAPNIKYQVTKELYAFTPKTLLSTFILASIFFYIFHSEVTNGFLLSSWYTLIILLIINRFYDYISYQKSNKENYHKWYQLFKVKASVNALLWGSTAILFFPYLDQGYQLLIILFLSGLAGGVTGFIFDFRISFIFITSLLLPLFVMLSFSDIIYALTIQTILLLFYILLLVANRHLNHLFYETYTNQERYKDTQERLTRKEQKLNSLLEQAPVGIFYYNQELKIIKHNVRFYKIFGVTKDLTGFDLNKIKDKQAIRLMKRVLENNTLKHEIGSYNLSFQTNKIWLELTCSALLDEEKQVVGGIGILEDKTTEHEAYEKINHISLHDSLTDLPNRRSYQEYMKQLIKKEEHQTQYSILFYMDLNHFKQINDTFGHVVGDKLLLEVAKRLQNIDIIEKYLSRIGGDEFILIVPFVDKFISSAREVADKISLEIQKKFTPTFEIEGLDLSMTTSIGIVLVEPRSRDTEQIIRQADMAMYQTKREGLNNIRFYDHTLDLKQQELTNLQHDLKLAIFNNELELYYQPIVDIKSDKLNAIEALLRWNHPTKGLIMPNMFIPMATESGLITKVGWWVAKEVCKQLAIWQAQKLINFEYLSININARQLNEVHFTTQLDNCITKGGIPPSLLKLELTETTLLDNCSNTQEIIKKLRDKGIECSIDDFGTGYSSLSYLKQFSFKVLKIDRIFIKDMLINIDNQELVKNIISIGKQFKYKIIIEGVETEEEKAKLIELDSNVFYQGFLLSKAIPAKAFEKRFLKN
jgi:diguanylate cyclase (GGDEF)-like protein/PAS domain S-box-containing protein